MASRFIRRVAIATTLLLMVGLLSGFAGATLYYAYVIGLPDHGFLATYEPPIGTQVETGDGKPLAEHATERRIVTPISAMPTRVVLAFVAAEDRNFFTHPGIDLWAIARASVQNIFELNANRRPIGASTITQQVARRFFLSSEISVTRKLKEIVLATRLERDLGKQRILELYLNEIYFGRGVYGVATAAQAYFRKSLDALTLPEIAYLAALPKAPNNYNPARFPDAAKARRNWVIAQMLRAGTIGSGEADEATRAPLGIATGTDTEVAGAGYFNEDVRRDVIGQFGARALYADGLTVRTTLDLELQTVADHALRAGLVAYDRRHGWRGRIGRLAPDATGPDRSWIAGLAAHPAPTGIGQWRLAVVLALDTAGATIGTGQGEVGRIQMAELKWARPALADQRTGAWPRIPSDVLAVGDVILVEPIDDALEIRVGDTAIGFPSTFALRQIPEINGAIVALDPHTGGILAMSGGYMFSRNTDEFNRATQAQRQPGSAFKPFVYLAALNDGFTPSSLVSDGPIAIEQGPGRALWEPRNYDATFFGPRPLRFGLEQSRNLMTVRLAERIGMEKIADVAERFGIVDRLPRDPSMALGAGETTLLKLTTAYAELANGGWKITPALIDWIKDRRGAVIYDRAVGEQEQVRLDDPRSIYQVVSMLRGVIDRGTGARAQVLGKGISGKTGTTNDEKDAWFIGFSADIVCGVFVGFDQPRTLGPREQGASVALPIFVEFMREALKKRPAIVFPVPSGITMARVREVDGYLSESRADDTIMQAFRTGTLPLLEDPVLDETQLTAGEFWQGLAAAAPSSAIGAAPNLPVNLRAYGR